jgi:hypothetical protein
MPTSRPPHTSDEAIVSQFDNITLLRADPEARWPSRQRLMSWHSP